MNFIWKILSEVLLTPVVQANQFTVIVSSFDNNIREQIVLLTFQQSIQAPFKTKIV